jgi:hypothetical protein
MDDIIATFQRHRAAVALRDKQRCFNASHRVLGAPESVAHQRASALLVAHGAGSEE